VIERGIGKGTCLSFRLDREVFEVILPCRRTLRRLIFEAAHLFPGVILSLEQEVFHAPNGLADLASLYYAQTPSLIAPMPPLFSFRTRCDEMEINVGVIGESTANPLFRSWANGSATPFHGTHVTGLRDAIRSAQWKPAVPMIHVIMNQPEFAGPTRGQLTNSFVRKTVRECVKPAMFQWKKERL
jgi:DNA gyrase subunit B